MTNEQKKVVFCWSGGKDSALALHRLLKDPQYRVVSLLTTFNTEMDRVSMHGVRRQLMRKQVEQIGLPFVEMEVSASSNEAYEESLRKELIRLKQQGVEWVAFGDIFLEDLRSYRESKLAEVGMNAVFPLWGNDTRALLNEFWEQGFSSVLCCVNARFLGEEFLGKELDRSLLQEFPEKMDPCGENGEYHSFCWEGPIYQEAIVFQLGEKVYREFPSAEGNPIPGFWYIDLIPE